MFLTSVLISSLLLLIIVFYVQNVFNYWKRRGVPYIDPSFPFGNMGQVFRGKRSFNDQIGEFYQRTRNTSQYLGLYFFQRKVLLVTSPDLVKKVLSSDFKHFHTRGMFYNEENEPLTAHLVSLSGERWRTLRQKLTPTFTPNKMKLMFEMLLECANEMTEIMKETKTVEIHDISSRYTTDVVGSTAFGINCHSLEDPDAEFRQIGKLATTFKRTSSAFINRILFRNFPWLAKKLKIKMIDKNVSSFFMKAVVDMVDHRTKNQITRNDFLQLLINLMPGNAKTDSSLSIQQVAAQCFIFFIAGVETSASTITFALFELAKNQTMQERVRQEIRDVSAKEGGRITYGGVLKMQYLEMVILETLRKYPAFTFILRKCTEDYQLPDTTTVLEKGTTVFIPVYSIQHDARYYPDPEVFDPERFSDVEMKKRNENVYLPFGDGPRICIGRRFAMFQVKLALATSLRNYHFSLNEKSTGEVILDDNSLVSTPTQGIYLDIAPVSKNTN